jgi:SAM-dependent methyltransferase
MSACAETPDTLALTLGGPTEIEPRPEAAATGEPTRNEPAIGPEINAYYENADVEHWQEIFERPGREVFDRRFEILNAIGVYPGMTVADVGAGTGFFTMLFARAVGSFGKVYAVDISESFVADIERRAAEYRVDNVETIVNDQKDTGLPADSVDLVFLCDTYHHFEYPRSMLSSIARALKDDGELVIIDFRRIQGVSNPWVMSHVRANREEVTKEVLEAGFSLVEDLDLLRENYVLRFSKALPADESD